MKIVNYMLNTMYLYNNQILNKYKYPQLTCISIFEYEFNYMYMYFRFIWCLEDCLIDFCKMILYMYLQLL